MRVLLGLMLAAVLATQPLGRAEATKARASGRATANTKSKRLEIALSEWWLDNGLHVVFSAQRRVPAVTVQVWYHVGSKDEQPGLRGVAHMFEHMMFKGSRRVPPEKHAQMLAAVGGSVNAFTTEDVTAYHDTVPRQYLDFAIQLEAERMRSLLLTDATIHSEREVVKEEKRMRMENSPIGRSLEAIQALAYRKHSYAWTPAGDIPDLNRVTRQLCERFYKTYYVPNNATVVVVGDVSEADVRSSIARYFGPIARGADPPRVTVVEPPQMHLRAKVADWPSQLNVVLGAYRIPAARDADMPALRVLSAILSTGHSSRLHQALVRKRKLALYAGGYAAQFEQPGLFFVYAYGLPAHHVEQLKTALLAEVDRIGQLGVTEQELSKARNQLTTRYLRRLETVWGLANQIGSSTYIDGDPRAFLDDVDRLDRVTRADVKRVAASYLNGQDLSLVLLPAGPGGTRSKDES